MALIKVEDIMKIRTLLVSVVGLLGLLATQIVVATETENLNIQILPNPEKVVVDGNIKEWDLSGGVFVCSDVEILRDKMGVWIYTMYDADNLYVLARWLDESPLSNPGSIAGSFAFEGDSLQLRIIGDPENSNPKPICWVTAWRDRDGIDLIDIKFPNKTHKQLKNAKVEGAQQAFLRNEDGKGYVQEIALPWKLLIAGGLTPKAGQQIKFSVEANFNTGSNFRITMKDIFLPGETPDRIFTFTADRCWGLGTFAKEGNVEPQKLRLADKREFDVTMKDGKPVINWTGLYESKEIDGFAKISLDLPEDGFVSLNIKNSAGLVMRQLLTANFMTAGKHDVLWDGLTNLSHLKPGDVVPSGNYTWEAIYHSGLGLRMVGWADNGGSAPFDSPGGNWGGDHGKPSSVTTDGEQMYLGWSGSEAGKAIVCTDLDGKVKWRHKHGGFGGANHITTGDGIVYVNDGHEKILYRIDAEKGNYNYWEGTETALLPIGKGLMGLSYANGKLYLSQDRGMRVLDAKTGKELKVILVDQPGDLETTADGTTYLLSAGKQVLRVKADGEIETVVSGLNNARGLAIDKDGDIYVGILDPINQVHVYSQKGERRRSIGKGGGRPLLGPWDADGMRFVQGLSIDAKGHLWVAENDSTPKRFSCWNSKDGSFLKEFFGPTAYGAVGGAISPVDQMVMVGSGCEWRLDPHTGRANCTGVFHRKGMSNSRFGQSPDGRLYVAVAEGWISSYSPVDIYERVGEGEYTLRTRIEPLGENGARIWSDINDDQNEQPDEVKEYQKDFQGWLTGWYMSMTQDMEFMAGVYRVVPTGWTQCGAPEYDLDKAQKLPAPEDVTSRGGVGSQRGIASLGGKLVLYNGHYGRSHSDFVCYDVVTGMQKWSYPNTYVGVHGGHKAPPPQIGMIRGAYDIVGTAILADPIGDIFVIGTDKGEWHILTGEGFYLSKLFEANPLKIQWPEKAVPGAIMDMCPPGMGTEDFGGSIIVNKEGELYLQAGKTAFINIKVVGLDTVKKLKGRELIITQADTLLAENFRGKLLQSSVGVKQYSLKKLSDNHPDFFKDGDPLEFEKDRASSVKAAIAYDEENLYLGWQVNDETPWINGASDPAQMYAMGDTVDFQIGTDAKADAKRTEAVLGDLRLSIGNFQGQPTAVVFRRIATEKHPRKFYSGVVRDGYEMQSVLVLKDAELSVTTDPKNSRYTVQAVIPLKSLGLNIEPGLTLKGDIGVTHGDKTRKDTVLRTYWNNQGTGLVADEVFELKMEPANWGTLTF